MPTFGRLSENTLSALLGAAAFGILSAGTAVAVTTSAVTITNPTTGKRALVTNQASLVTSERDAVSGTYGKVDSGGRRLVGDGSGPLTVDGTVREALPAATWGDSHNPGYATGERFGYAYVTVPTTGRVVVRSVSALIRVPTGQKVTAQVSTWRTDTGWTTVHTPLTYQGTFYGSDVFVMETDVTLYPAPGGRVEIYTDRSENGGSGGIDFAAFGDRL